MSFWSKAGHFISDAFTFEGKTKDKDYQDLCEKMTIIETGVKGLKEILKGFHTYSHPFVKYIETLNESIKKIYSDSPLKAQITEIIFRHELILEEISNLGKIISKIYSKTSAWDTIFKKAKESIKQREEKRKDFDYYEQKLLKIDGTKDINKIKDFAANSQEKYKLASKEYIEISEKSFEIIKNSIKLCWELTNPVFSDLIISEKNLFEVISSNLSDLSIIISDFNETMNRAFNPESTEDTFSYDPKKFIKSQKIIKKSENNYEHVFIRNTNTFGEIPPEKEKIFIEMKDNLFNME